MELTLYSLETALAELLTPETDTGEPKELDLVAINQELASMVGELAAEKRDNVARFILTVRHAIEAKTAEAKRLRMSADTLERNLKEFEQAVIAVVQQFGTIKKGTKSKRLEGNSFSLLAMSNTQSRLIVPENRIPADAPAFAVIPITVPLNLLEKIEEILKFNLSDEELLELKIGNADWNNATIKAVLETLGNIDAPKDASAPHPYANELAGFKVEKGSHLQVK